MTVVPWERFKTLPKGAVLCCRNGHALAQAKEDIPFGTINWGFRLEPLTSPSAIGRVNCPTCGFSLLSETEPIYVLEDANAPRP